MTLRKYMVPVYGRLVMFGKYTLDPQEEGKEQVPDIYIEAVAEWLVSRVGN